MVNTIWFFLGILIGFIACMYLFSVYHVTRCIGHFEIDTFDPDKDIYRIVYEKDPAKLKKWKYVLFRIETDAKLSQDSQVL